MRKLVSMAKETEFDLRDVSEVAYYGPAFFGSTPMQGHLDSSFNYDTGSGFLTVASAKCTNCYSQYYDPDKSTTSKQGHTDYSNIESLMYGSATLKGKMYTDDVCLDPS